MTSRRPRIAAVVLGCCTEATRCVLCAPPRSVLPTDAISALLEGSGPQSPPMRLGFYGGAAPTDEQLACAQGRDIGVRVRPDLLKRDDVRRLVDAGVVSIELDALSLDNAVLRAAGRRYRRGLVLEQLTGLAELGVEVGIVLAPGLPESTFDTAIADAEVSAPLVQTARIHPVLVVRYSGLYTALLDGLYTPLTLGEAVTVSRAMLDVFEGQGARVIRVGQQGGPDGIGVVTAGPAHPSLRELVEARRTLDHLRSVLQSTSWVDATTPGGHVELRCAPADVSRARGPLNQHVRTLRAEYGLDEFIVRADPTLPRGNFRVNEMTG